MDKVSRRVKICKEIVDRSFLVHNGKEFFVVDVKLDMVGYKFGDFVFTRSQNLYNKVIKLRRLFMYKKVFVDCICFSNGLGFVLVRLGSKNLWIKFLFGQVFLLFLVL